MCRWGSGRPIPGRLCHITYDRYPSRGLRSVPRRGIRKNDTSFASFDRSFWRAAAGRFGARWLWRSRAAVRRGDQVPRHVRAGKPFTPPRPATPQSPAPCLCVDSLSIPSPFPRTPIRVPRGHLSPGCRAVELSWLRRGAVEALSRRCRGAVEALSRPCLSSLSSYCRVPVEPVEPDSVRLGVQVCRGLSRSVEVCRGLSRSVEVCRVAVELSSTSFSRTRL